MPVRVLQGEGRAIQMTEKYPPLFFSLLLFLLTVTFVSSSQAVPTHLDRQKLKKGCAECHKGHGTKASHLLKKEREEACFQCHSLSGTSFDIKSEVLKPSKHPVVETAQYHVLGEDLPERSPSQPRHVSCLDCHNVHKSEKGQSRKGLRGYSGKGFKVSRANESPREYEICYNCHSDSSNLTRQGANIALDFSSTNSSFHPVETYGSAISVPSLKGMKHTTASLIDCSDCHGNDNPQGPKGPHGSLYSPLLKYRYNRTPGPESPSGYGLCYSCHNRSSILNDESFKAHKAHIVYNQISCAQCHVSHGSRMNRSLMAFDTGVVFANTKGSLTFISGLNGKPRCFLSCHVNGKSYDHGTNAKLQYCIGTNCPSDW